MGVSLRKQVPNIGARVGNGTRPWGSVEARDGLRLLALVSIYESVRAQWRDQFLAAGQ